ncbi:hypothetical protein [Amycolatopsis acididurans]|uniref:hypothetical protein n=1 Tax=Amycolatopsis acididurans TaxID=2724524 RepID=UPI001B33C50B|nr:hypothetical protein [Amycolatopsis acididurans]
MTKNPSPDLKKSLQARHSVTSCSERSVPAAVLLRRLGWHQRRVSCRDLKGRRSALLVQRRAAEVVEVQLADGHSARLSNVEAGRLRAVLRDVLIAQPLTHENASGPTAVDGFDVESRCRDLT